MKLTKKHILLSMVLFALGTTRCTGLLDLNPPLSETTNNFYVNEDQAFQALVSTYSVLNFSAPQTADGTSVNCAFEVLSEIMGDCCFAGGEGGAGYDQISFRRSTFTARVDDNAAEALWKKYYTGIYRCNIFFANIDRPPFKKEVLRERYKAEAHFLRAYYYFDLVRLFGNVPLILRELTPADYNYPQSAPEQVYEQIAKDLLAAIEAVDEQGNPVMYLNGVVIDAEHKGHASLASAKALLARVWLYYTGYYNKAELPLVSAETVRGYLTDVINDSSLGLVDNAYDITDINAVGVSPLFTIANNNNKECVFEIQFSGLGKAGYGNRLDSRGNQAVLLWGMRIDSGPYMRGWSYAPVDKRFWDKFASNDPRRDASIINANADGENIPIAEKGFQHTGYFGRKYTSLVANKWTGGGDPLLNWPNNYYAIRFADVLLMASEMELLHGGSRTTAFDYYKRVRERALGVGNVGITADQLDIDKIYDERLFELALEGHRYWDILRRGPEYAKRTLEKSSADDFFKVTYNTTRAGLLPIPLYDILQSKKNLKQNPGY